jgi:hypothetical protein
MRTLVDSNVLLDIFTVDLKLHRCPTSTFTHMRKQKT